MGRGDWLRAGSCRRRVGLVNEGEAAARSLCGDAGMVQAWLFGDFLPLETPVASAGRQSILYHCPADQP